MNTQQHNAATFRAYVTELAGQNPDCAFNPKWVVRMLTEIELLESKLNPDYLRATREVWFTGTPLPEENPPLVALEQPSTKQGTADMLRAIQCTLSSDERKELWDYIQDGHCKECAMPKYPGGNCPCWNDE